MVPASLTYTYSAIYLKLEKSGLKHRKTSEEVKYKKPEHAIISKNCNGSGRQEVKAIP